MNSDSGFEIKMYEFNSNLLPNFHDNSFAKNLWPVVYILSDDSTNEAYVGETTDTIARMTSHLASNKKNKLTAVHIIASHIFHKSATLDIESNLIKYISGDGKYKLLNGNVGLANHNYYQKVEVYWGVFQSIWNKLRSDGISEHSIEFIDNSDLFKYSPYKTLSTDQKQGLLVILKALLNGTVKNIIVEGGAGTGKTVLAIFIFKLLSSSIEDFNFKDFGDDEDEFIRTVNELKEKYPNPKMALVVPMSSFRNTLAQVFKNVKGLKASMVIGPAALVKEDYDIVFVDESHRLRRRKNLGTYFGAFDKVCSKLGLHPDTSSELDWVLLKSKAAVLFYDENQSIKPSDVLSSEFDKLKSAPNTKLEALKSQFRVRGGADYVKYIDDLLRVKLRANQTVFISSAYEFLLFDSIEEMVSEIKLKESQHGLSRLIAGFSWPWISKTDKSVYDIEIQDLKLQWNSVADDFINSKNAVNEVGCIHTTQGYDLNYSGIIFGNEISYDKAKDEIVILKDNYFDRNGKQSVESDEVLKAFILNIYKTIMLRGIRGTYVYVCDKGLRDYFARYITKYQFRQEAVKPTEVILITAENGLPIFDFSTDYGRFVESQNENFENLQWVEIPLRYRPFTDFFACKVTGDSMDVIIPDGSICLFKKYTGENRDGMIVLAEHKSLKEQEFGSGYIIREFHRKKHDGDDLFGNLTFLLKPLSNNLRYGSISLSTDSLADFIIIGVFECVLV